MAETRQISPAFYEALGRITTSWSFLEAMMNEFLGYMLKSEPGFVYVISQSVSNSTVIGWIRTTLKLHAFDAGTQQEIVRFLNRADEARAERNVLVHGWWLDSPDANAVHIRTVRYERKEIIRVEVHTLADLQSLQEEITDLVGDLKRLGIRLGFIPS